MIAEPLADTTKKAQVLPGLEPGLQGSKPWVLTNYTIEPVLRATSRNGELRHVKDAKKKKGGGKGEELDRLPCPGPPATAACRHRRDLNSRGQSPLAFKTNSLTTRTRCLLLAPTEKNHRHRRDLNSRGQSPVDFESTSLTTRTRCLQRLDEKGGSHRSSPAGEKKKKKFGCVANPSFDLGTFRL